MEVMINLLEAAPVWLTASTVLVTAANGITMLTPTKVDNRAVAVILRVLNVLSMNIGRNKNADD